MPPRRPLLVIVVFTVFLLIFFGAHHGGVRQQVDWLHKDPEEEDNSPKPRPCTQHLGWLEPYQLTYPIRYVSRDIITTTSPTYGRPSLTIQEYPLFEEFNTIDLAESMTFKIDKCLPPLELEVPHGRLRPADASNLIFGMQTTMHRLKDTVKHLARWLPGTGARLYAIVIDGEVDNHAVPADDLEMEKLAKEFKDRHMNVVIMHPVRDIDSFAQRYFSLVDIMYKARTDKTEWVITIDDDTLFPSMHELLHLLSKFDPSKQHYLGGLSEDWWAVNNYGLMGFGGAGVFLSTPLAAVISEHNDDCKEHLRTSAGDISVMDCIYKYSSTKLTPIPSLHQIDMRGDGSGFYESGREMLSLHHWKEGSSTGYRLEVEKMHLVADICDSCFLQRWQFPNDLVLTNGYSINHYPLGHITGKKPGLIAVGEADKIDLYEMEHTWADDINVQHSLAPIRAKMTEESKVAYKLLDSVVVDNGGGWKDTVRQVYFREGVGELDTIMVLNWRAGPGAGPDEPPREWKGLRK